jgi:hypothetical protein
MLTSNAHPFVEMTLFHDKEKKQYTLHLINIQPEPALPVPGFEVKLRLPGEITQVLRLPDEQPVAFTVEGDQIVLSLPSMDMFSMLLIKEK